MILKDDLKIAIIGLGYVGLPLAVEFAKKFNVTGFDTSNERISELKNGIDSTLEVSEQKLSSVNKIIYSSNSDDLEGIDVYIITVPTPIDEENYPDFAPLIKASQNVGKYIKRNCVVIYESTVYPGATEEVCVPELEKFSGLKFNKDFYVGYSPERINPGDKINTLTKIKKITSGSNPQIADFVNNLYLEIIDAGTFCASTIKVAEAAKVIENTQRGVNIALINEFSQIFGELGIDTQSVLEAAGTKWNFLKFKPGLVGGHCIGVDPYYLIQKAKTVGINPKVIESSCNLNDRMGEYVASKLVKGMIKKKINVAEAKILVMGYTFKENCPDIRNTKVEDIINYFDDYGIEVDVYDPWVNSNIPEKKIKIINNVNHHNYYDAIMITVAHDVFLGMGIDHIRSFAKDKSVIFDVKGIFPIDKTDIRL